MRVRTTPLRSSMSRALTPSRCTVLAGVRYRSLKTRAAGGLMQQNTVVGPPPPRAGEGGEGEATSSEQAAPPLCLSPASGGEDAGAAGTVCRTWQNPSRKPNNSNGQGALAPPAGGLRLTGRRRARAPLQVHHVDLLPARHDDVAGLLVRLAGADPFRLDLAGRIARCGGTTLAVRHGGDRVGGIEIARHLRMRGDRSARHGADRIGGVAGRRLADVLLGAG